MEWLKCNTKFLIKVEGGNGKQTKIIFSLLFVMLNSHYPISDKY